MAVVEGLFWASLAALVWTHAGYPLVARGARARAHRGRCVGTRSALPTVALIVAAHNEEDVIERRLENLRALDYPADRLEIVVTLRRVDRPHRGARRGGGRAGDPQPARRQGRRPGRAVRETTAEIVAFSDANCDVGARRAAQARPLVRRPGRRLRLRPAEHPGRRRREQGGPLLALRARAARRRVAARLGHRRQRLDLRGAPRGLRRGRPALRPRPLVPVPDGAARPARGLRAGGERVREGDADERGRVPPQGADVRALLGDRRSRGRCCAACGRSTSSRSSRTGTCATRAACSISSCSRRRSRSSAHGALYQVALGLQLGLLAAARVRRRHRPLLRARHVGDRRRRS